MLTNILTCWHHSVLPVPSPTATHSVLSEIIFDGRKRDNCNRKFITSKTEVKLKLQQRKSDALADGGLNRRAPSSAPVSSRKWQNPYARTQSNSACAFPTVHAVPLHGLHFAALFLDRKTFAFLFVHSSGLRFATSFRLAKVDRPANVNIIVLHLCPLLSVDALDKLRANHHRLWFCKECALHTFFNSSKWSVLQPKSATELFSNSPIFTSSCLSPLSMHCACIALDVVQRSQYVSGSLSLSSLGLTGKKNTVCLLLQS